MKARIVPLLIACLASLPALAEMRSETKDIEATAVTQERDRPPGIIPYPANAEHLDPLIATDKSKAPFYPSRATTKGRHLTEAEFKDAQFCAGCHAEIYAQWKDSVMAHAWDDPIYRAILARGSAATQGAVDNFCIGCHSPIGLTTGTAQAVGEEEPIARGIDCESCHNISEATGVGNGSYVLTPNLYGRPLKFGPRQDAVSPYHDTAYSDLHTKSEFCGTCHNVTHPFNRMPVERTYDEWRDSIYSSQGVQCQDCHMTPGAGINDNPGKAALMGKERPHVYSHYFTGGNVSLHNHFGQTEMAERARKMLRSAATIEFVDTPEALQDGGLAQIQVKVTNVGAGHKLPTGFPEGREMWVDFKVVDATGQEIYRLGAVRDGLTEPGTKSFKAVIADAQGTPVDINVWEADRLISDTRILPKGYAMVEFSFPVPPQAQGPLQLTADLNYWNFPQHIADELLGEGALEIEIVRMASVQQTLPLQRQTLAQTP